MDDVSIHSTPYLQGAMQNFPPTFIFHPTRFSLLRITTHERLPFRYVSSVSFIFQEGTRLSPRSQCNHSFRVVCQIPLPAETYAPSACPCSLCVSMLQYVQSHVASLARSGFFCSAHRLRAPKQRCWTPHCITIIQSRAL